MKLRRKFVKDWWQSATKSLICAHRGFAVEGRVSGGRTGLKEDRKGIEGGFTAPPLPPKKSMGTFHAPPSKV